MLTIKDMQGVTILPVKGVYSVEVGSSIDIEITILNKEKHPIDVKWTAVYGEISFLSTFQTFSSAKNNYTSNVVGNDYVKIFILDKITETKLQEAIIIQTFP